MYNMNIALTIVNSTQIIMALTLSHADSGVYKIEDHNKY